MMRRQTTAFIAGLIVLTVMALGGMEALAQVEQYQVWNYSEFGRELDFQEAPILTEKVAAGELPPIEDRLPENPLVVQPVEAIGRYGGVLRGYGLEPTSFGNDLTSMREVAPLTIYPSWEVIDAPGVFESYIISDDNTIFTGTIRKGIRWSDGAPFTADDIMFWYEDILMNKELSPSIPSVWTVAGEPVVVEKIDDYTVEFKFAASNGILIETMATTPVWAPKHYLSQWHIDYNPDAAQIASEHGFEFWHQLFNNLADVGDLQRNPDLPTLEPWVFSRETATGDVYYERNPYYWKVDTEGNQLPYIDTLVRLLVPEKEQVLLQIQSGQIDYGNTRLLLEDMPVLRAGEARGGYRTVLRDGAHGSIRRYVLNLTTPDPVLREIFQDLRFRQALSLAIDRDEINDTLYFGLAVPRQHTTPSFTTFYEDWMGEYYAQYDPAAANALLDEMGLTRSSDGYRMRPDGQPLVVEVADATASGQLSEMVTSFWQDIGIRANLRTMTRDLFSERTLANDVEISVWFGDVVDEFNLRRMPEVILYPPYGIANVPKNGGPWARWWESGGQVGEEPPAEIRELFELAEQFLGIPRGAEGYDELGRSIVTKNLEGLYAGIGTVGMVPAPNTVKNNLRNFPEYSPWIQHMRGMQGDQWFWDE